MAGHDSLWTTAEVAALFRVDRKTVRRWVERGRLPEVLTPSGQPGYRESEVRALLDAPEDDRPGTPDNPPPRRAGPRQEGGPRPRGARNVGAALIPHQEDT